MKINKKIIFILLGIFITIGITYASWQAGGGVKWIAEDANEQKTSRFIDNSSDTTTYGISYYTDTYTGLKWQAYNSYKSGYGEPDGTGITNLAWSVDTSYTEPIWNGTSYDYPTGTTSSDYPAFAYCEGLGDAGWRLPTKIELFSIMTDTIPEGMNYYTTLPNLNFAYLWSSTAFERNTDGAWYGRFHQGYVSGYLAKTQTTLAQCVHD